MALLQHIPALNTRAKVVLASASPRRRELLGNLGLKFEVVTSSFDEKLPHSQFANGAAYAVETARQKGAVAVPCLPGVPANAPGARRCGNTDALSVVCC